MPHPHHSRFSPIRPRFSSTPGPSVDTSTVSPFTATSASPSGYHHLGFLSHRSSSVQLSESSPLRRHPPSISFAQSTTSSYPGVNLDLQFFSSSLSHPSTAAAPDINTPMANHEGMTVLFTSGSDTGDSGMLRPNVSRGISQTSTPGLTPTLTPSAETTLFSPFDPFAPAWNQDDRTPGAYTRSKRHSVASTSSSFSSAGPYVPDDHAMDDCSPDELMNDVTEYYFSSEPESDAEYPSELEHPSDDALSPKLSPNAPTGDYAEQLWAHTMQMLEKIPGGTYAANTAVARRNRDPRFRMGSTSSIAESSSIEQMVVSPRRGSTARSAAFRDVGIYEV
ncbi:hypothetical protein [Phaffia rhodozyma]|uniref:Uncharacterized protein n=1 Tax=Phaffia rhodozyma TaxID=264483 RepID=A0A0F7ST01_PHARH|nr:hypothetical protein [Phaffia rhodozyma]